MNRIHFSVSFVFLILIGFWGNLHAAPLQASNLRPFSVKSDQETDADGQTLVLAKPLHLCFNHNQEKSGS